MLRQFPLLAEGAIQRAIENTKVRVREAAVLQTPVWTGRLLGSFDIASTPRSIVFKWDAKSDAGFPYAGVVDVGRTGGKILTPKTKKVMAFPSPWKGGPIVFRHKTIQGGFVGRRYSDAVHQYARDVLREELEREFLAIGG
jgi:hypothetical protein